MKRALLPFVLVFSSCKAPNDVCPASALMSMRVETMSGMGSGVVIASVPDDDSWLVHIMTAGHVVTGAQPLPPKEIADWAVLERLHVHPDRDAAVIVWRSRKYLPPVELSFEPPHGRQVLWTGAYPADGPLMLYRGIVSERDEEDWWVSAPAAPGSSGAPLFDSRGRLVGITLGLMGADLGLGMQLMLTGQYFLPLGDIQPWLMEIIGS